MSQKVLCIRIRTCGLGLGRFSYPPGHLIVVCSPHGILMMRGRGRVVMFGGRGCVTNFVWQLSSVFRWSLISSALHRSECLNPKPLSHRNTGHDVVHLDIVSSPSRTHTSTGILYDPLGCFCAVPLEEENGPITGND